MGDTMDKGSAQPRNKGRLLARRILWVIVGNLILGIGCGLLRVPEFGTDPFNCMNLGVSSHIPLSYGTYQMLVNFVLLIPMIIWYRKGINIGSFVNMIGIAYISDFTVYTCGVMGCTPESIAGSMVVRIVIMLAAVLLCCVGIAFYVECELGVAPYDALGQMIEGWTGGRIKFSIARIMLDVVCVAIGFFTGSIVGVSTLIMACMTGPLVTFAREHLAKKAVGVRS